jgi:hypothetical protein
MHVGSSVAAAAAAEAEAEAAVMASTYAFRWRQQREQWQQWQQRQHVLMRLGSSGKGLARHMPPVSNGSDSHGSDGMC